MVDLLVPELPRTFELNGDEKHDKEEEMWAAMNGCSAAPVGRRDAFDTWREDTTIKAPEGWQLITRWCVTADPILKLASPRETRPWENTMHGDVGTQEVGMEVSAKWADGQLFLGGEVVDPDDLHKRAKQVRTMGTSPAQEAHFARAEAAREQVRLWYRAGRLGDDPREAGDWLDAVYVFDRMPRPLVNREKQQLNRGLAYLEGAGLLHLATELGVDTRPRAVG